MSVRLGLHRMSPDRDTEFRDYVARVRPNIVKFLDPGPGDDPLAAWCQSLGVQVVGRKFFDTQYLGAEGGRQAASVVALARQCSHIRYWELHNEAWHVPGEMARYADLSIGFMDDLERQGQRAVIGCFSEGTPQVDGSDNNEAWRQFAPAVNHAIEHGHALGLHEYNAFHMAALLDADGTGWHALRYRKSLAILRGLGVPVDRLVIFFTETGLDDIQDAKREGPPGKGWKDYDGTEWAKVPRSPYGDFAGQMAWYCTELSKDPQVGGVVDFGWATRDRTWWTFDLSDAPAMRERVILTQTQLPGQPGQEAQVLEGIDVSHHQGVMNWPQAKAAGAQYAIIKATEGWSYVDPQWATNALFARRAGLPIGAYHYFLNALDPIRQAEHFAATVKGVECQLPPVLDLEDTTYPLDEAGFVRFAQRVEKLLGRPMVYTGKWFTDGRVDGDLSALAAYPLMLADYSPPYPVPAPWTKWTVLQYTSKGNGPAFGAQSQYIDRDRFDGTMEQLLALRVPPASNPPTAEIDWTRLVAHAEAEQAARGIRMNAGSALIRAIQQDGLEVVLGESDFQDGATTRTYVVGESVDAAHKTVYVWLPEEGRVAKKVIR